MPLFHSKVYGIVQGVGFRPFVARLADKFNIYGSVSNKGPYVEIFAAGTTENLAGFYHELEAAPPERASILKVDTEEIERHEHFASFEIIESAKERGDIFVSPDIAICDKCQHELFDAHDRRYLHPFINCTACGPRLTILKSMPYDRERTTMGDFPMCEKCHEEYVSPETRRYDAQPVCCNNCGPEVYILGDTDCHGAAAITRARQTIIAGGIIAIKGIGGFHLCCDASNTSAVARLRELKHRPVKPFAVMARDIATVRQHCEISAGAATMLTGHQKPIVLLPWHADSTLAPKVAPGNPKIGMLLPYAPLHLLLFSYPDGLTMPDALIMTSGNPSGAPICRDDAGASQYLTSFTDLILTHNRQILIRADDTVMDWYNDEPYMIRRSRGFAPLPFMLGDDKFRGTVLGIGGELKNTFCVGHNSLFYPSPYVGDMSDLRTVQALKETVTRLTELLEAEPTIVATDMHPRYNTAAVAGELGLPVLPVQHHYAHILACMAENEYLEPVIGVSFDGTGYGTDGTIWGGELLLARLDGFERLGHIRPFRQAGGDKASTEGWRIAVAMLYGLYGQEKTTGLAPQLGLCSASELQAQFFMLGSNINVIKSTSAGRLFDAVSALLGIRLQSTFEGEASMYLEFAAEKYAAASGSTYSYTRPRRASKHSPAEPLILDTAEIFRELVTARLNGADSSQLSYDFHARLADEIILACELVRERTGLEAVALSGGVFQNTLLLSMVEKSLTELNFTVLRHHLIPPNDGGLCLGQALAAMYHINKSV